MPVSGDTSQLRNYEDSELKKHQRKTSKYTCPPLAALLAALERILLLEMRINGQFGDARREALPQKDCRFSGGSA